jgi:hypothetical protein
MLMFVLIPIRPNGRELSGTPDELAKAVAYHESWGAAAGASLRFTLTVKENCEATQRLS